MLFCRPPAVINILVLVLGACGPGATPRIGDAYPRDGDANAFLAAIKGSVSASGVMIQPWSVGKNAGQTIQLNSDQASVFADDRSIVGVVGHSGSRDALLGAAVYNLRGVPQLVPNATSRRISSAGPWTFPMVPNDSVEGKFIADFAVDSLQVRRVSILYLGDEYGLGLRDGVQSALRQRGIELADAAVVPTTACSSSDNEAVHRAIVMASVHRAKPDAVVLAASVSGSWCLANIVHAMHPDVWILGADGMGGVDSVPSQFSSVVPNRLRSVTFWTPASDSVNRAFVDLVRRHLHRDPTAGEALQYDAFMLLATAVRSVGNDRRAIRSWLASLGSSHPAWNGVTGAVSFGAPRTSILRMDSPRTVAP